MAFHLDALLPPLSHPAAKTLVSGGSTGRRYEKGIAGRMSQRVCRVRVTQEITSLTRSHGSCQTDTHPRPCLRAVRDFIYFLKIVDVQREIVCAHSSMQDIHSLQ